MTISGFLHALEFYDGILFLTTNRVGAFDDAIMSRVHIQMFYPNLNAAQRLAVWYTFINKLEAEKPSMQAKYAVKEYLRSGEMKDFEMNGREIRKDEIIDQSDFYLKSYTNGGGSQLFRLLLRWLSIALWKVKVARRF